ncbi:MAG: reverse gyrase [Parcubacteria group bacterium Greene0714_21]|nr:MAG: reverse gyrase [Parcubacteria group bacterium Greene0416_39]TSC98047.1 MAG: reverse gyrase [Parcubacteria group bacterium Greene1014_47]TSD04162.1 MAG: reverse gyrase [Parcubacteria group bacterium Greene0714_21]
MKLIVVESPAKGRTIESFLGKEYRVLSSYGHIRDLPKGRLGIDVEKNFEPTYVIPTKARKTVTSLKAAAKKAESVTLATDEDREGEAIAWHLAQVLDLENPQRIVFHEITKSAIEEALKNPRTVDINRVNAQQARRILDRLVGYELSPFLWQKVAKRLSAGRVQSVAVRLIADREKEIKAFTAEEYWSIEAILKKSKTEFSALLSKKDTKAIGKLDISSKEQTDEILKRLEGAAYHVADVEQKEIKRNPFPPFTTSTLQQEGSKKLHFSSKFTMSVAQQLYERGLCVDEDTLVVANDGAIYRIAELEHIYKNTRLVGMEETTLQQAEAVVPKFWKLPAPSSMINILTESNDEITVTEDHPLFVIRNGSPQWVEAKHLVSKDSIASLERIAVSRQREPSTVFDLIKLFPPELRERVYFRFGGNETSFPAMEHLLSTSQATLEEIESHYEGIWVKQKAGKTGNAKPQKLPLRITPELAYIVGFIAGDGHLDTRINFAMKASEVGLCHLRELFEKVLDHPYPWLTTLRTQYRLQSTFLYHLFQHLGIPKGNKSSIIDIPNILLRQPDEILHGYIAGLWDTDGCITKSWRNSIRLSYSSRSKVFIDKLQLLLKTFGIPSSKHLDKRNQVYWLLVSAVGVPSFHKYIAPRLVLKKEHWKNLYQKYGALYEKRVINQSQGIPTLNKTVDDLLKAHGIPKHEVSKFLGIDFFNYFGKTDVAHTRNPYIPKQIATALAPMVDTENKLLWHLGTSPVVWKKIKQIKHINYTKQYVYDVTTSTKTFIANGIVSHNCTYHRTDSLNLAESALTTAQSFIQNTYGNEYAAGPRRFKTKTKGAQEAHEAIRPTNLEQTTNNLTPPQKRLYDLIWKRFIASQMAQAVFAASTADIHSKSADSGEYTFRATGQMLKFDGFLKAYPIKFQETQLPLLEKGELLNLEKLIPAQHFTEAPPRYTEASLIKALEEHGVGRPSTYAPTLSTIQDRGYIEKDEQKRFYPTDLGNTVNDMLVTHFPAIVDIAFTAHMEQQLDNIAKGEEQWVPMIKEFYEPFAENLQKKYLEVPKKQAVVEATNKQCPLCTSPIIIRTGRFGKFYACSTFPKCKYTESLQTSNAPIGMTCPKCSKGEVVAKRTKRGKIFYGCNTYPSCDFATWQKPKNEV